MTDLEYFRALPEAEKERLGLLAYHRETRQGTHGPDCWSWGHAHYECLLRHCKALEADKEKSNDTANRNR